MIELTSQAVSFTAAGMFLFVVVSSAILGIKWTEMVCGIASALGVLGIMDLLVYAGLSYGYLSYGRGSWVETLSYDIAVAILAFYFLPVHADDIPPQRIKPEVIDWAKSVRGAVAK